MAMEQNAGKNRDLTAANRKRMRDAEEKKAAVLRDRGWVCIPPEEADDLPTEK